MSDPITGLVVLRADELHAIVRAAVTEALAERTPDAAPRLVDSDAACALLGVSRATLYRLRREGLPELRVGDTPRYEPDAVIAWLRARGDR